MQFLENPEATPLSITEKFNKHFNMFRAVSIALAIILAFERKFKKTKAEIALEYLFKYNPDGNSLYNNILPQSGEQALTCLNYVYLQSLKMPAGKIYIAEKSKNGGNHLVYVFELDGQRHYIEPNMIEDQAIQVKAGESIQNEKYSMAINEVGLDGSFSTTVTSALGNEFPFNFNALDLSDYDKKDFLGFLSFQRLHPNTQIYISNRFSKTLEAIILKGKDELVFVLPDNESEIEILKLHGIKCEPKGLGYKFTLNINDLKVIREFIEAKFGIKIYRDLIVFRKNISTLNQIQSLYANYINMA